MSDLLNSIQAVTQNDKSENNRNNAKNDKSNSKKLLAVRNEISNINKNENQMQKHTTRVEINITDVITSLNVQKQDNTFKNKSKNKSKNKNKNKNNNKKMSQTSLSIVHFKNQNQSTNNEFKDTKSLDLMKKLKESKNALIMIFTTFLNFSMTTTTLISRYEQINIFD